MTEGEEKLPRKPVNIDDMLTPCTDCGTASLEPCVPECFCLGCQMGMVPQRIDGTTTYVSINHTLLKGLVEEVIEHRNEKTLKLLVPKEQVWEAQRQADKWRLACLDLLAGECDRGIGSGIPYDGMSVTISASPDDILDDIQGIEDRFEVYEHVDPQDDEHRDLLVIGIKRHEESNADNSAHRLRVVPPTEG